MARSTYLGSSLDHSGSGNLGLGLGDLNGGHGGGRGLGGDNDGLQWNVEWW